MREQVFVENNTGAKRRESHEDRAEETKGRTRTIEGEPKSLEWQKGTSRKRKNIQDISASCRRQNTAEPLVRTKAYHGFVVSGV